MFLTIRPTQIDTIMDWTWLWSTQFHISINSKQVIASSKTIALDLLHWTDGRTGWPSLRAFGRTYRYHSLAYECEINHA
jgi:hypothetical protein